MTNKNPELFFRPTLSLIMPVKVTVGTIKVNSYFYLSALMPNSFSVFLPTLYLRRDKNTWKKQGLNPGPLAPCATTNGSMAPLAKH